MRSKTLSLALVCMVAVQVRAITVRPVRCPTNKIAPHKRSVAWDEERINEESDGRTFGAYYELLVPERFQPQNDGQGSLQEVPETDPEDCGDIDDYDENDLSSMKPKENRRHYSSRFFGAFRPHQQAPPPRPDKYPPKRPPQGGYFNQNAYRPQAELNPSAYVKPVHEDNRERPQIYRPSGTVGVPLLTHIVGMNSLVPTEAPPSTRRPYPRPPPRDYFPSQEQHYSESNGYPARRERPRTINNEGVIGSFVDLLFK